MRRSLIISLLILFAAAAKAQPYDNAVGVRLGFGVGLTYKTFLSAKGALEFIASYQYQERGYQVAGLYELHNYRAFRSNSFALMYGFGMHLGYYNGSYYKNRQGIYYLEDTYTVGIDGILGIDYHETGTHWNWSMDIKPAFDFVNPGFRFWDGAVSVRYTL
jgi:hypothetical protein